MAWLMWGKHRNFKMWPLPLHGHSSSEGYLELLRLFLYKHLLKTVLIINITEWKTVGYQYV